MKKFSWGMVALLLYVSFALVSCNTGKKFNYASAYKFNSSDPYLKKMTSSGQNSLTASLEDSIANGPDQLLVSSEKSFILPKRVVKEIDLKKASNKSVSNPVASNALNTLTVKEIRREIRVGFKKYRTEIKEKNKVEGTKKTTDNSFLKGLVLVILGIVVIVAGILLIGPIGVLAGSLIAALGLILFLIGLLGLIL